MNQASKIKQLRHRIQSLKRAKFKQSKLSKSFNKMSAVDVAGSDRMLRTLK